MGSVVREGKRCSKGEEKRGRRRGGEGREGRRGERRGGEGRGGEGRGGERRKRERRGGERRRGKSKEREVWSWGGVVRNKWRKRCKKVIFLSLCPHPLQLP